MRVCSLVPHTEKGFFMKVPKIVIVDAGVMLGVNNGGGDITARESARFLVDICSDAGIPVYITGAGLEIVCLEQGLVERAKGTYLETHRTEDRWYDACVLSRVAPCDAFYLSSRQRERIKARSILMVPVAVGDPIVNRLGHCLETALHTERGLVFPNLKLFVDALDKTLQSACRRTYTPAVAIA